MLLFMWGLLCAFIAAVSMWPPRRHGVPAAIAFFIGWLVTELPWHAAIAWTGVAAVLAWLTAPLDGVALAGLGLVAASVATLAGHARSVRHAHVSLGEALAGVGIAVEPVAAVGFRKLLTIAPLSPPGIERVRNVSYGPAGWRNSLDVWRPDGVAPGAKRPALLYVHGGAWVIGDKDLQGLVTIHELCAAGWVCFSMNYRLSPRATFPAQLEDVRAARAWIRAHAAEYGADPDFLVLCGGSAGGHLASLAALTARGDQRVQGCVSYYGVYDLAEHELSLPAAAHRRRFLERLVFKRSFRDHPELFEDASPIHQVSEEAPPFFVLHGAVDSLVPVEQARHFVEKLRKVSRAPVVYAELPATQHAFEVFVSPRSMAAVRAVRRWCESLAATRPRDERAVS